MIRRLILTTELLARTYDFLAETEPYVGWNLPESEDVNFRVGKYTDCSGWYKKEGKQHIIGISSLAVTTTFFLIQVMGHEMIHLHEAHSCIRNNAEHSSAFRKFASSVRIIHGFDP